MRVVKRGKTWGSEFRCVGDANGCDAVLHVEQADVYGVTGMTLDGKLIVHNCFMCCACGVETEIVQALPFAVPSRGEWILRRFA